MDLDDRVAIVTGAGSGLGRVLAEHLARHGARIVIADADPEQAAQVATQVPRSTAVPADVLDPAGRNAILQRAEALGGPHILINNAGGWGAATRQFPDASPDEWRAVVELNLAVPMELTQRCRAPMTRCGGGVVVNVASSAGTGTKAYGSPEYGAAKAGLIRFTTALGDWIERYCIRVNCVVPDWIGLDRAHAELAALSAEERATKPPLVPPEDIAATVLQLIRDDAASGQVIVLDGGRAPRRIAP